MRNALGQLEIVEPARDAAVYADENTAFVARWLSSSAPDSGQGALRYVWTSDADGEIGRGLRASHRGLSYRTHRITLRAFSGETPVATAETSVAVVIRPDQFTLSERTDWEGEFSPSGNRVAYTSYRSGDPEVWIATVANQAAVRITYKGGMSPTWSPDGQRIAFWSERAGSRHLWLVHVSDAVRTAVQITSEDGSQWMPAFSPVDQRLAFISKSGRQTSLMVLSADQPDAGAELVVGPADFPLFPRWSSDGRSLLFTTYRDTVPAICAIDLEQKSIARISNPEAEDADISPDGSRLVFVRNGEIWLQSLKSGLERPLTRESSVALSPRFSRDGEKIIYASTHSGNYDLWLLDLPPEQ